MYRESRFRKNSKEGIVVRVIIENSACNFRIILAILNTCIQTEIHVFLNVHRGFRNCFGLLKLSTRFVVRYRVLEVKAIKMINIDVRALNKQIKHQILPLVRGSSLCLAIGYLFSYFVYLFIYFVIV